MTRVVYAEIICSAKLHFENETTYYLYVGVNVKLICCIIITYHRYDICNWESFHQRGSWDAQQKFLNSKPDKIPY